MTCRRLTYLFAIILGVSLWAGAKPGKRAASTPAFHGIDVSHHQGNINWATVASDQRVGFVYIRASNGTRSDKNYRSNIAAARKHGLLVGSYHFLNPNCPVNEQFNNFMRLVKAGEQDLVPVIDIEDVPELGVFWKPQQARNYLSEFIELVRKHYGVKPMIYTSNTFFTDYLGRAFADFPLFIARYGDTEPAPLNGANWTLWQFTRQGRVDGINHVVDLSRFNHGCGVGTIKMHRTRHHKKHPSSGSKHQAKADSGKKRKGAQGRTAKKQENRTSSVSEKSPTQSETAGSKKSNRTSSSSNSSSKAAKKASTAKTAQNGPKNKADSRGNRTSKTAKKSSTKRESADSKSSNRTSSSTNGAAKAAKKPATAKGAGSKGKNRTSSKKR